MKGSEHSFKIVYWGIGGSGKTTILKSLYKISKQKQTNIMPTSKITQIAKNNGSTLYFDRCFFNSANHENVCYRVFTVAGQWSFSPLRKKITEDADGIIFVADSQKEFIEDNIESIKELKNVVEQRLIKKIPFIIMLNKQDLNNVIDADTFRELLKKEKLWYDSDNPLSNWNPIIYETCALYEKHSNIAISFEECARRTLIYNVEGDGNAPDYASEGQIILSA